MPTKITRRRALSGTAGVAIATIAGAAQAFPADHPDVELLKLGEAFMAAETEENRFFDNLYPGLPEDQKDAAAFANMEPSIRIAERIKAIRATTIEGMLVKARVIASCHDGDFDHLHEQCVMNRPGGSDNQLAWSIALDLLTLAGPRGGLPNV